MSIVARPKRAENVAVGARLARLRHLYGWTQGTLAHALGWVDDQGVGKRARVAQLETGRVAFANVNQREMAAQAFGLTLDMLNKVLKGEMAEEAAQQVGIRALVRRVGAKAQEDRHGAVRDGFAAIAAFKDLSGKSS